jgi:hypothetical protein
MGADNGRPVRTNCHLVVATSGCRSRTLDVIVVNGND